MVRQARWDEEAEVVVIGCGGAGAATAISAHDAGAKVLILEKQPSDTPTRTQHTPSTRMSGGGWFWPEDVQKAIIYLEAITKVASEPLDAERKEQISVFAQYLHSNLDWMKKIGIPQPGEEDIGQRHRGVPGSRVATGGKVYRSEHPTLPGAECCCNITSKRTGKYRDGAAFFKYMSEAVQSRGIPVTWETPAAHLITHNGEVRGVVAISKGKEVRIKASRGVVLTCGGFEFNEWMKQNYLRAYPVYFTGNPGNTGDGINMALEAGAALWHMNKASWRATLKIPDSPCSISTQLHETASIFVDKRGKRFTNERYRGHTFGYELTPYDAYALTYPRIPFYWIFDEKRRAMGPLAGTGGGVCNPPAGIMGDIHYIWSADNQKEIDRGWIMKASTMEELASKTSKDPDDNGLLSPSVLLDTVKRYNEYCRKGEDPDFHKGKDWLQPLENPPYYAVKLWPGGPNTQGGPKRNVKGQVVHPDNSPIPRLYSAGELGSFYAMLYPVGGGNLAECMAFGRISGANAASEKPWK